MSGVKLDNPGGETIKIEITVNGNLHYIRHATITERTGNNVYRYVLDDGTEITHQRNRGYKELAEKVLQRG